MVGKIIFEKDSELTILYPFIFCIVVQDQTMNNRYRVGMDKTLRLLVIY
jgi:hypothetical protein